MRRWTGSALLALTLGVGACGGGDKATGPNNQNSTSNSVTVADDNFNPSGTTVAAGTVVTWTWRGASPHNVTFDDGTASATQSDGTFQRTFGTAGSFRYHCTIHGSVMSGTVTVQ